MGLRVQGLGFGLVRFSNLGLEAVLLDIVLDESTVTLMPNNLLMDFVVEGPVSAHPEPKNPEVQRRNIPN